MASPPTGFVTVADFISYASEVDPPRRELNVMGVVVDYLKPRKTGGTDWKSEFRIRDTSSDEQLAVHFFKPQDAHPPIQSNGDVIMIGSLTVCYTCCTISGSFRCHDIL